jgi:glutamate/tyrosine decarboxylase-like PLP-dependent enzyme
MQFLACLCGEQNTMAGMAAFVKTSTKEGKKSGGNSKRIEITMGITCHTCHAFSVFGLGTRF